MLALTPSVNSPPVSSRRDSGEMGRRHHQRRTTASERMRRLVSKAYVDRYAVRFAGLHRDVLRCHSKLCI
jgi:hypothetical protein